MNYPIKNLYMLIFLWLGTSLAYADIQQNLTGISTIRSAETATTGNLLIFVSFSMPETSLVQWFLQAKKVNAPLIIRGLFNNSLKDTRTRLTTFISENNNGVIMDPRLFSDYQIIEVPAVVVRNTAIFLCKSDQSCWHVYPSDVVYGDVGLDYALQEIADQGDNTQEIAKRLLSQLRTSS
jgi:conjugal transfer pilus assembly protein TrbC